ncbi:zinc finger protein 91-like [Armigeres subalbatus]|uniref:zinc finger protein 91-like n=1 Tax=Armigeres subalbatus TaxID=124917 RepID=UPI002ED5AB0E
MASDLNYKTCFICCQGSKTSYETPDCGQESRSTFISVVCQHFWFQEDDLLNAIFCVACWSKVDSFHRFYQEVKQLHAELTFHPPTNTIKQEEIDIDEEQHMESHEIGVVDEVTIKTEIFDDQLLGGNRDDKDNQITEKKHKKSRKISKVTREAQDEVIREHRQYRCDECDLQFYSFCTAIRHRIKKHNQASIECCDRQFKTRSLLYHHVLNPGAFKCEVCNRTFKFLNGYLRHKREQHAENGEPLLFKCQRCPESFNEEGLLKRHLTEHIPWNCEVCGRQFRTRNLLQRHTKAVHREPTDYICQVCSKGFYKRQLFVAHQKIHELTAEEMKKQCEVCHMWLKNQASWEKHVVRHQYEGQYKCDDCDHVSVNLLALKVHRKRRHSANRKEHLCDLCGKGYSRAKSLKEHMANAHTGVPLYECQYCAKSFFSSATMYAHRKRDHPQEWMQDHGTKRSYGVGVSGEFGGSSREEDMQME